MSRIQNEKGYALLLVMLLVVLFTIIGMGLLVMNMNAAKQFDTKEAQVQARHQAEMGVLDYKAQLENIVKNKRSQANLSCLELKKNVFSFSDITNSGYTIKNEDTQCKFSDGIYTISIESIGKKKDYEDKIKANFYVNKLGLASVEEGEIPSPSNYNDTFKKINGNFKVENGFYTPTQSSLHVTGNISVQSGNSSGGNDILINRNLFVDQGMDFKNHACLVTRGNLVVKGNITSGNKVYIFVYGDAYFNSYSYTSNNNDIFVSGRVFENGVEVRNKYNPVPSGTAYNYGNGNGNDKKTCSLPGSGNTGTSSVFWSLNDKVDVDYFVE